MIKPGTERTGRAVWTKITFKSRKTQKGKKNYIFTLIVFSGIIILYLIYKKQDFFPSIATLSQIPIIWINVTLAFGEKILNNFLKNMFNICFIF